MVGKTRIGLTKIWEAAERRRAGISRSNVIYVVPLGWRGVVEPQNFLNAQNLCGKTTTACTGPRWVVLSRSSGLVSSRLGLPDGSGGVKSKEGERIGGGGLAGRWRWD